MGDNVVDGFAREIMARFQSEVQTLLEKVKAENARLEARVGDVEQELCNVREALTKAENDAEGYRRWAGNFMCNSIPRRKPTSNSGATQSRPISQYHQ